MDEASVKPSRRRRPRKRSPPGSAPGTLVVDPTAPKPVLTLVAYGPEGVREEPAGDLEAQRRSLASSAVLWLDVAGLGDGETIQRVGKAFGLHRLALEDVVNVHQRPKVEAYGDHHYLVARSIEGGASVESEQLSIFLGRGFVVTFQEKPGGCFDPVRERIRSGKGVIRSSGPDYLAYALLDAVVDGYFPALERLGERLEELEEEIVSSPESGSLRKIHAIKRDLLQFRRAIWPLREALSYLLREDSGVIAKETRVYLNDCYDHTVQIMDFVETSREVASGLMDVYLSSVSNQMNQVMKVLTLIATIFIPLTFLAGIYGMNFDTTSPWNMPELRWRYGYVVCLAMMAALGIGLVLYFRRLGWLGGHPGGKKTD